MPCEYEIDSEAGIVLTRAWGRLTDRDLVAHQSRLKLDESFHSSFNQLADFREVEDARQVTVEGVRNLADRNPFAEGSRRAFLTSTRVAYGLGRMFQSLTYDYPDELRVVFDEAYEARQWLGLPAIE